MAGDPFVPCFAAFMRVQRGIETAQDLVAAFPALEEAALASAASGPGLSEQDRRRLLDYPNAEEEAANIRRLSSRTRADLLSTVASRATELTDAEIELLRQKFWADVTPQEMGRQLDGSLYTERSVQRRVQQAQAAAAPLEDLEWSAWGKALYEQGQRRRRREEEKGAAQLASRPYPTPAWMSDLAQQCRADLKQTWGFIALYDAEVLETTSTEVQNRFEATVEDILLSTRMGNGATQHGISSRWRLYFVDPPRPASTANTTTAATASSYSSADEQAADYGTTMRNAFRTFLESEVWRQHSEWEHGIRTDVFLVVNKECIDSVLLGHNLLDDMRIAAYEADFTRSYDNGYEGWTWVRLQQLVYRFYGAACTREDIKMHDIWRAARVSKYNAFVSLDPEVARGWTTSTNLLGQREPRYDAHF